MLVNTGVLEAGDVPREGLVGLTAHDMSDMGRLAQLAMNPKNRASREEIYLAVASLYRIQGPELNNRERDLTREILRRLTRDVEMAVRIALAERLADDITAPPDLILLLVDDAIEVARPLILRSPLLTERDMLGLVAKAGLGHQEAVAERPHIGVPITDALVQCQAASVLVTLARNATAKISETAYQVLVERSRAVTGLQEPLLKRADLPLELAHRMSVWVSDALKSYIQANYKISQDKVAIALSEATDTLHRGPGALTDPPADSAQKLIEKLAVSGQIKASFLMRVLSQGQIDLFELAFARLLELDLARFRQLFYDGGVRVVALACRAGGIDKAAFPTVFNLSRQARHRVDSLGRTQISEAEQVFGGFTRPSALAELRSLADQ
jgi:uncharacterized protein (DUF2336 family)